MIDSAVMCMAIDLIDLFRSRYPLAKPDFHEFLYSIYKRSLGN